MRPRPMPSRSCPLGSTPASDSGSADPTILAVDFYSRGDFIKEVDRLNGVAVPGSVLATAGP